MSDQTPDLNPEIIDSDSLPDWDSWDRRVKKIVVGKDPKGSGSQIDGRELPTDFATRFDQLTHLHLWGLKGLKSLPKLPESLQTLDLRQCPDLEELESLPTGLTVLDLGICVKLKSLPTQAPPGLKILRLDGCTQIQGFSLLGFLASLKKAQISQSALEELRLTAIVCIQDLEQVPVAALEKLVLAHCSGLTDVSPISSCNRLQHLDLQGCFKLRTLPKLPHSVDWLHLHGCDQLTGFLGQTIGVYERGKKGQNVIRILRTREKFAGDLAILPHAKLLLMGDGRVGKTTLAKRLQWDELSPQQRAEHPELKPSKKEKFTHKVQFFNWRTGLSVTQERLAGLKEQAAAFEVKLPLTQAGQLDGSVRIWDFGGQELYHNTHRIFAVEGSIFLLVWREEPPDPGPVPEELKGRVTEEEWSEWNRHRPLHYWLDYVDSLLEEHRRKSILIALVCTACRNTDKSTLLPNWKAEAGRHSARELKCFHVDSLDDQGRTQVSHQKLVEWIRESCGKEADRISLLVPRLYLEISDMLGGWLLENSANRNRNRLANHLLCRWPEWKRAVQERHRATKKPDTQDMDDRDLSVITQFLHDAGHLFLIRGEGEPCVLVDQEWGASLIYQIFRPEGNLRGLIRENGGWFYGVDLENDEAWKRVGEEPQRQQLIQYMLDCRVITLLARAKENLTGLDLYLASDKWLLPLAEDEEVKARMSRPLESLRSSDGVREQARFDFENTSITEFDFRALYSILAQRFQTSAVYHRHGLMAFEEGPDPGWIFEIHWVPENRSKGQPVPSAAKSEPDSLLGRVDATLYARSEVLDEAQDRILETIHGEGSPFHEIARPPVHRKELNDLNREELIHSLTGKPLAVGLSSCGADGVEAAKLQGLLKANGVRYPKWYRDEEYRIGKDEMVLEFVKGLGESQVLILLISADYLKIPEGDASNWYCAYELADAIRKVHSGERKWTQTLVVLRKSKGFDVGEFSTRASELLTAGSEYFLGLYEKYGREERKRFKRFRDFADHFDAALEPQAWNDFFSKRSEAGKVELLDACLQDECKTLIRKIHQGGGEEEI